MIYNSQERGHDSSLEEIKNVDITKESDKSPKSNSRSSEKK